MGAPKNSVVTIHTSLKAVGETEGRGEGLLDAFIEYFTEDGGLLTIPSHTWSNYFKKGAISLDLNDCSTCIGTLPNIAVARKDGHRSKNPTHSMVVFGEYDKAEKFIQADDGVNSCTPLKSCYGNLYSMNGYILLVGVGQEKNTFLHCAEEILKVKNRVSEDSSTVTVKNRDGSVFINNNFHMVSAKDGDKAVDVSSYFPKLEPAFKHHNCITYGKIGDAFAQLCDARKIKEVMELIYSRANGKELLFDDRPLDEKLYI